MKTFASIAQAIYRDGGWTGSVGLVSHEFKAKGFKSAQLKARRFYMAKWRRHKPTKTAKLKKLAISVVEY